MSETAALPDVGGPAQPLLAVRGLVKHFPIRGGLFNRTTAVVQAVDDIDFDVAKGETLGIVGESGCGKSTTARLLVRLLDPDSGELVYDGLKVGSQDGLTMREMRRHVQMVFQDSFASLNPRLTIEDGIAFAPQVHGLPRGQAVERAHDLLSRVGLEPRRFAARYPHELSGGQRQRVNIARALALQPRVVILDEAVSALDKSVEAQVLNLLLDLKEAFGLTYVFISHDLNVVRYMSDRVMVMYLGQVVEVGEAETLFEAPRHPYTRALLSSIPSRDPDRRTEVPPLAGDPPNPISPPPGCRFHTRCAHAQAVQRAHELLARVGLEPRRFAARYPHELSGGQRQRVNIARALALQPRVVILDEAVSALDKSVEAQVLNLLLDLKAAFGLTYVFISHDLNVVRYMSDRVMVMYLGQVVEIGPAQELFEDPRHPYTRALLSSIPSMDPDQRTEVPPLAGDPPNPISPPPGCRFHTRCARVEGVCAQRMPVLAAGAARAGQATAHPVACLMYESGSGHSQAPAAAAALAAEPASA